MSILVSIKPFEIKLLKLLKDAMKFAAFQLETKLIFKRRIGVISRF